MGHRAYFSASIEQLEAIAEDPSTSADALREIHSELLRRRTPRSVRLRWRLDELLKAIEAGDVPRLDNEPLLPIASSQLKKFSPSSLSTRAQNFLKNRNISTVAELAAMTEREVLRTWSVGKGTFNELKQVLHDLGLGFGMKVMEDGTLLPNEEPERPADPALPQEVLSARLSTFDLSTRARNYLRRSRIRYIGQLAKMSESEIQKGGGVGKKTVSELRELLQSLGARFGLPLEGWEPIPDAPLLPLPSLPEDPPKLADGLRAALEQIDHSATASRNIEWTIAHLGWSGNDRLTLEAIGAPVGVTRERVRQIMAKHSKRLRERGRVPQSLKRALEILHANIPLPQSRLDSLLHDAGLIERHFNVDGIYQAAKVFGLACNFVIDDEKGDALILPLDLQSFPGRFMRDVKGEIAALGAVVEDRVQDIAEVHAKRNLDPAFIKALMLREPTIEELKDAPGWWWRPASALNGRNRFVNMTEKVLAATSSISIRELRDAVRRHVRTNHLAPPSDVMRAIYRQLPRFQLRDDVLTRAPGSEGWEEELSDSEKELVAIFSELGPVIGTHELTDAALARGLNENSLSIYKSYSPILWRISPGYYALVGQSIAPGTLEALQAAEPTYGRTLIDFGWSAQGEMVVCRSISRSILSWGQFTIPAAGQSFIQGEFQLLAFGRQDLGRIEVKDASVLTIRHFLRSFGADEGDTLVMSFDPSTRVCRAWLGSGALAEEIRDDGIDRVLATLASSGGEVEEDEE